MVKSSMNASMLYYNLNLNREDVLCLGLFGSDSLYRVVIGFKITLLKNTFICCTSYLYVVGFVNNYKLNCGCEHDEYDKHQVFELQTSKSMSVREYKNFGNGKRLK